MLVFIDLYPRLHAGSHMHMYYYNTSCTFYAYAGSLEQAKGQVRRLVTTYYNETAHRDVNSGKSN